MPVAAPGSVAPITVEEIARRWTGRTLEYRDCRSDQEWEDLFLEPVERFGLTYCLREHDPATVLHAGFEAWCTQRAPLPAPAPFPLERITGSTQPGVLIGIVYDVVLHGTATAPVDPEGWFDNPQPLLMVRPDGTAIVRDGNHRVCGGKLRGDTTVLAHAIPHDFDARRYQWPDVDYQAC